jgi:hypothetical protein
MLARRNHLLESAVACVEGSAVRTLESNEKVLHVALNSHSILAWRF